MKTSRLILPVIVVSQFFCTSLWFAGNAVINGLQDDFGLAESDLGHLTSVVQFGFIIGTLLFAVLSLADRFSPSKVFVYCALLGALFNLGVIWEGNNLTTILVLRFFTGFFLAGIYPVGMKIASDYYDKGLGKSLGYLVGALVLGTAFPHLLGFIGNDFSWKVVLITTSLLATTGGALMVLLVPDGPFRKVSQKVELSAFFKVFKDKKFRSASFGYFGHMWELYTFWAFVPVILKAYAVSHPTAVLNVPLLSFFVISIGAVACVVGGYLAQEFKIKSVASVALLLSGLSCLLFPFIYSSGMVVVVVIFLLFWGVFVIMDSPLFSTLVAQNAPAELKGTALTIVNCIGYSITIVSIQLVNQLLDECDFKYVFIVLAIGPVLGLIALLRKE